MAERTWFRTVIIMQPFCLQATMNAKNASPSRTRGTQTLDPRRVWDSHGYYPNGWNKPVQTAASAADLRPAYFAFGIFARPSPSMRRPVDVKAHFCFLVFFNSVPIQLGRPCRHPSIRTLCERSSLGARWVFSFSRCCCLIIDLSSYLFGGA